MVLFELVDRLFLLCLNFPTCSFFFNFDCIVPIFVPFALLPIFSVSFQFQFLFVGPQTFTHYHKQLKPFCHNGLLLGPVLLLLARMLLLTWTSISSLSRVPVFDAQSRGFNSRFWHVSTPTHLQITRNGNFTVYTCILWLEIISHYFFGIMDNKSSNTMIY